MGNGNMSNIKKKEHRYHLKLFVSQIGKDGSEEVQVTLDHRPFSQGLNWEFLAAC